MAENQHDKNKSFLALKAQIEGEVNSLATNLQAEPEGDLSDAVYRSYAGHMNYIQGLFDNVSLTIKELDMDQSNPELYQLLTAKRELDTEYGVFSRIRGEINRRFAKNRESQEEEILRKFMGSERQAEEPAYDPEPEGPVHIEDNEEEELLLMAEEEALEAEAREAKRKNNKDRQQRLANEARNRDLANAEEEARRQEAARLGMRQQEGRNYSEAELQRERSRQDEVRREAARQQSENLRREREAFEAYRQKISLENFERLDKSHNSLSPDIRPNNEHDRPPVPTASNPEIKYSGEKKVYTSSSGEVASVPEQPRTSYVQPTSEYKAPELVPSRPAYETLRSEYERRNPETFQASSRSESQPAEPAHNTSDSSFAREAEIRRAEERKIEERRREDDHRRSQDYRESYSTPVTPVSPTAPELNKYEAKATEHTAPATSMPEPGPQAPAERPNPTSEHYGSAPVSSFNNSQSETLPQRAESQPTEQLYKASDLPLAREMEGRQNEIRRDEERRREEEYRRSLDYREPYKIPVTPVSQATPEPHKHEAKTTERAAPATSIPGPAPQTFAERPSPVSEHYGGIPIPPSYEPKTRQYAGDAEYKPQPVSSTFEPQSVTKSENQPTEQPQKAPDLSYTRDAEPRRVEEIRQVEQVGSQGYKEPYQVPITPISQTTSEPQKAEAKTTEHTAPATSMPEPAPQASAERPNSSSEHYGSTIVSPSQEPQSRQYARDAEYKPQPTPTAYESQPPRFDSQPTEQPYKASDSSYTRDAEPRRVEEIRQVEQVGSQGYKEPYQVPITPVSQTTSEPNKYEPKTTEHTTPATSMPEPAPQASAERPNSSSEHYGSTIVSPSQEPQSRQYARDAEYKPQPTPTAYESQPPRFDSQPTEQPYKASDSSYTRDAEPRRVEEKRQVEQVGSQGYKEPYQIPITPISQTTSEPQKTEPKATEHAARAPSMPEPAPQAFVERRNSNSEYYGSTTVSPSQEPQNRQNAEDEGYNPQPTPSAFDSQPQRPESQPTEQPYKAPDLSDTKGVEPRRVEEIRQAEQVGSQDYKEPYQIPVTPVSQATPEPQKTEPKATDHTAPAPSMPEPAPQASAERPNSSSEHYGSTIVLPYQEPQNRQNAEGEGYNPQPTPSAYESQPQRPESQPAEQPYKASDSSHTRDAEPRRVEEIRQAEQVGSQGYKEPYQVPITPISQTTSEPQKAEAKTTEHAAPAPSIPRPNSQASVERSRFDSVSYGTIPVHPSNDPQERPFTEDNQHNSQPEQLYYEASTPILEQQNIKSVRDQAHTTENKPSYKVTPVPARSSEQVVSAPVPSISENRGPKATSMPDNAEVKSNNIPVYLAPGPRPSFDALKTSHIEQPLSHSQSFDGANKGFTPREYIPGGIKAAPSIAEVEKSLEGMGNNSRIYETLMSKQSAAPKGALAVSSVYETQMRFNLESARLRYAEAKGTPTESAAVKNYVEQRNAYMSFRSEVNSGKINISQPEPIPAPDKPTAPTSKVSNSDVVYSYIPGGIAATTIANGKLTNNKASFENPGVRSNRVISPNNPLKVTPEYEATITRNMQQAVGSLNKAMSDASKPGQVSPELAANVQFYTDAYLGFQKAKRDGSVIISHEAVRNTPDFKVWQERQHATKAIGTTVQSKGADPNKVTKAEVEETVANIFSSSSKLKRESLSKQYFKQIGTRITDYGTSAMYMASRRIYQMVQDGDDNAIRTMETGRYYIATGTGIALAIHDKGSIKAELSGSLHGENVEFHRYGATSLLSKKELSSTINNAMRLGRERKAEIKALGTQIKDLDDKILELRSQLGAQSNAAAVQLNRTIAQRDALASKMDTLREQHAASNQELRKAISLKNFRFEESIHDDLVKELTKSGKPPKSVKQMDKFMRTFSAKNQREMTQKFGSLAKATPESLKREIARLKVQGEGLKRQIKLLESRGASLSQTERKLLKSLIDEHKALSANLRKHIGLSQARNKFDLSMKELGKYRQRLGLDAQRFRNGLFVLRQFMLRPLIEGGEYGTQGLAKFAQVASNRYVHMLVKQSYRASVFLTKGTMNVMVPGSADALTTAVGFAKQTVTTGVKVGAKTVQTAVKTGVKTAAKATGRGIVHLTPDRIKTAVKSTVRTANIVKSKYSNVATGIRNAVFRAKTWFAKTSVGRGLAAANRGAASLVKGVKLAGTFVKGAVIKIAACVVAILFLVSFIASAGAALFGSSASTVIMSPSSKDEKIDLAPYVQVIKDCENDFNEEIKAVCTADRYTSVTIRYATGIEDNTREMLSMMAVRMSQDLDMNKNQKVKQYLEFLYKDSHFYTTVVTPYKCPGCEKKTVYHTITLEDGTTKEVPSEVPYCPGHKKLDITITVLGFDQIFTADEYGNAGQEAVNGQKIGNFSITHYCCEKYPHACNAGPPYKTATGTTPTPDRTIAVDPNVIPLGSHVIINGKEYIAEDTGGGVNSYHIDICVETHNEALAKGRKNGVAVYWAAYEGESMADTGKWDGWTESNIVWCKTIYNTDWTKLYSGVPNVTDIVGTESDLSGVTFVNGERPGNQTIVDIAMAELGNAGGQKYWSWYGYNNRVEWCAIFVSWCANQAGYLNNEIHKFASCELGRQEFIAIGKWATPNDYTPVAGDIIFFDWEDNNESDHVGYVVGTDGSKVYTVEGNNCDKVRVMSYDINDTQIMGYGLPNY